MRKSIIIILLVVVSSCGSADVNEDGTPIDVTTETSEKLQEAQDVNIELEEIDGELDSLINSLD